MSDVQGPLSGSPCGPGAPGGAPPPPPAVRHKPPAEPGPPPGVRAHIRARGLGVHRAPPRATRDSFQKVSTYSQLLLPKKGERKKKTSSVSRKLTATSEKRVNGMDVLTSLNIQWRPGAPICHKPVGASGRGPPELGDLFRAWPSSSRLPERSRLLFLFIPRNNGS